MSAGRLMHGRRSEASPRQPVCRKTRAKWSNVISSVDSLKTAVAECTQNNAGDASLCQTAAALNLNALPTLPYAAALTVAGTSPTGTPPTSTITLTLDGSAVGQLGKCTVTETGTVAESNITWTFTDGGGCTAAQTGV